MNLTPTYDDNTNLPLNLAELRKNERNGDPEATKVQNTPKHIKRNLIQNSTMNLATYDKLKTEIKEDNDDDDYVGDVSLEFSLSYLQKNKMEDDRTTLQSSSMPSSAGDLAKSSKQSQDINDEVINVGQHLEDIFKKQQKQQLAVWTTTSPIIPLPLTNGDDLLDEESASSISITERTHLQITSIDGFFNRKRGRPPKNRFVEVYKNTHKKPQAIFTSFKLERCGASSLHTDMETLGDGENAVNATIDYSRCNKSFENGETGENIKSICSIQRKRLFDKITNFSTLSGWGDGENVSNTTRNYSRRKISGNSKHKPSVANSPQRNHAFHRVNQFSRSSTSDGRTISDTNIAEPNNNCHSIDDANNNVQNEIIANHDKNIPISNSSKICIMSQSSAAIDVNNCLTAESTPTYNNEKMSATTDNITVVRAAGTFYPENTNENTKFPGIYMENLHDITKKRRISLTAYTEAARCVENSNTNSLNGYDMPQDLSIKDGHPVEEHPPMAASTTTIKNLVLPQILNVLQMQQQYFALYQQMALMTPQPILPSHLDFKTIFTPTKTPAKIKPPSTTVVDSSDTDVPDQQQQFVNMLFSLNQMQQLQQVNDEADEDHAKFKTEHRRELNDIDKNAIIPNCNKRSARNINNGTSSARQKESSAQRQVGPFYNSRGEDATPSAYLRFRFNEDCGYDKCAYRQHQSHFHCNRSDCQYSFCDKTRFVQHTARHERLDTLMGSDFQQFRATMTCNYDNCPFNKNNSAKDHEAVIRKSSHFHCLKCTFVCADTNKVVAHRRLHSKMEFIRSAGFRRISSNEECICLPEASVQSKRIDAEVSSPQTTTWAKSETKSNISGGQKTNSDYSDNTSRPITSTMEQQQHCPYSMRHAHYHCLLCNSSVLSRSQLVAHKHRFPGTSMSSTSVSSTSSSNVAFQSLTDPKTASGNSNVS